jgi:hypothetical protein
MKLKNWLKEIAFRFHMERIRWSLHSRRERLDLFLWRARGTTYHGNSLLYLLREANNIPHEEA